MQKKAVVVLKEIWGFEAFRGSQKEIIDAVISGKDVLALLPTGGGKSICYQVPALVNEGICIVVSPLVALIQDQVDRLKLKGIKAIALTGGISFEELNNLLDNCLYGNYKFLYLSPERLQQSVVQQRIREMNVNLIAIDEAHCISQWGNDFRPAYLECAILRELAPNSPMIALTATATPKVVEDILENLELKEAKIFKDSFSRSNIIFKVKKTEDKLYQLKKYITTIPGSSIVYVRSRKMSLFLAEFLNKNGCKASFFHGGISRAEKKEKLSLWLDGDLEIMVATNAFGMGVDKPNVRLVVHYQVPDSLESYFQEAGRAGRDGETATAVLLNTKEDEELAKKQFITSLPDVDFVKKLYAKLNSYFQISYGESTSETFALKFNSFCRRYEFNPNMAYHGLRILDQNSVINLSDTYNEKTTLRFIASKTNIFNYLDNNRKTAPVIQTILRTYGGITDYNTSINIQLISKKTGEQEKSIKKILEQLQTDGIAEYRNTASDLEINFLIPREDERTINTFANKIRDFNKVKQSNMDAMLGYINNTSSCRSNFILNYFGEDVKEECGTCDICTTSNDHSLFDIKSEIIQLLKASPKTSRKLAESMTVDEKKILEALVILLEDETVLLNYKNEYAINVQ
ncbi:RecQ family ATP-dependent DNA helicase [Flagellimonas sp. 389]|uniref:RecQ family ATP-dependent DNA helicase n=1 Tax=Flagellimonas sp. 389 TaxID=2835862 RepID=UPI001BD1F233|nr:ATP-dependent DNA helicase RecQ [uncultured Allomuricauda sp.]MBS9462147.1 RecQ family ATP-dependent DNA helicase [Flagellimonas sp. 389]